MDEKKKKDNDEQVVPPEKENGGKQDSTQQVESAAEDVSTPKSSKKIKPFIIITAVIVLIVGFIAGGIALGLGGSDNKQLTSATQDDTGQSIAQPTSDAMPATEEPATTATTEQDTQPTTTDPKGSSTNLLTGLPCSEEDMLKRPAAIMINNIKDAMPNVGIASADIVYECLVEGGQTRLLMLAADYEKIPVIGSVRSSRDYFIDLSQMHDALYVHAGGSDEAYAQLKARRIDRLDGVNMYYPDGTFYRDAQRRKKMALEHTLMTSGNGLVEGFKYYSYRLTHKTDYKGTFSFSTEDYTPAGWNADVVQLAYSYFVPQFTYNKENLKYYREQFEEPHIDGATSEQLSFDNIIILFAPHIYTGDSKGHLEVTLTGEGTGYYVSRGMYVQLNWQRDNRDGVMNLTDKDGKVLLLNRGKTLVSIFDSGNKKGVRIGTPAK